MNETPPTLDAADLGASKPVPKPPEPKQQPTQHPLVKACGHSLDTRHFPTHANCEDCYEAFFQENAAGLASVHQLLLADGTRAVTAIHGAKFTKALGVYLRKQLLKMHQQTHTEIQAQVKDITGLEAPSLVEIAQGE